MTSLHQPINMSNTRSNNSAVMSPDNSNSPSSLDYLYQAISLIETKNNHLNHHQSHNNNQHLWNANNQHLQKYHNQNHYHQQQRQQQSIDYFSNENNTLIFQQQLNQRSYQTPKAESSACNNCTCDCSQSNLKQQSRPKSKDESKKSKHYNHHNQSDYMYAANILTQQQLEESRPVVHSRLEKAKQLARKINLNENLDHMSTNSSVSPCSSYSMSPVCSPHSSFSHSTSPSTPTSANAFFPEVNHFIYPPAQQQQQQQQPTQQVDLVANILPFYLNQYLNVMKGLHGNGNTQHQSVNEYLQTLTSAIYALVNYQQQQQASPQPNFPQNYTPQSTYMHPQQQQCLVKPHHAAKPKMRHTMVEEKMDEVVRKVDEHFKRSLGASNFTAYLGGANNSNKQQQTAILMPNKKYKFDEQSSSSCLKSISKKLKKSPSIDDLDGSEHKIEKSSYSVVKKSISNSQLIIDTDEDSIAGTDLNSRGTPSPVSTSSSNDSSSSSTSCYQKNDDDNVFVDTHFSKALGQNVWTSLKEKLKKKNAISRSSVDDSAESSLNSSFSNSSSEEDLKSVS